MLKCKHFICIIAIEMHRASSISKPAINQNFVLKHRTYDSILAIMKWSLEVLASGTMPEFGHDGQKLKGKRATWSGKSVPKAVCAEVRADWMFLKHCFKFPQFNQKSGICWQCKACPKDIAEVGPEASWRTERLTHWDFMTRLYQTNRTASPLMSAPCVTTSTFLIDWLHIVDLGIACDILGSLFMFLLSKFPGASKAAKCSALFLDIKSYYSRVKPDSQLDNLKMSMIKKQKAKSPKLRAKAAEARFLVPYALEAVNKFLSATDIYENTVINLVKNLHKCYENLSPIFF